LLKFLQLIMLRKFDRDKRCKLNLKVFQRTEGLPAIFYIRFKLFKILADIIIGFQLLY
jgi:hypothetical protein